MKIKIRKAKKRDFEEIFKLICELAEYEKLTPPDVKAKERLYKDAFGKKPLYYILVSEFRGRITGYVFYFFTYSSFLARKTLYLEDIYISQKQRKKGTGRLFMDELIRIARKEKCGRMEWCVLNWNKDAISFYNKLGAEPLNEWIYYRLIL
ncbi:MAG: GNAT family N-acetyltransferase [Ignavibacteria bacterium]|nr:GNAT family N-acetyltransferase [Ignavibacteria bacterium]